MRSLYFIFLLFNLSIEFTKAQTVLSLNNGYWNDSTTWDCNCIPTNGVTIGINHEVILSNNLVLTSGIINVNQNGVIKDQNNGLELTVSGGTLNNYGEIKIKSFKTISGTFNNTGNLECEKFQNNIYYYNFGTFNNIDSIINNGLITNNGNITNAIYFENNGIFTNNHNHFANEIKNNGSLNNNNKIQCESLTNNGQFLNRDTVESDFFKNTHLLTNDLTGVIKIEKKLLNQNLINESANINNNGLFTIHQNLCNHDTIQGVNGMFEIQDTTQNYGTIKQSIMICDLSPPSFPPFIDINSGTVSVDVSWCITTSISDSKNSKISFYPNPANEVIHINIEDQSKPEISIMDFQGKSVIHNVSSKKMDIINIPSGLYIIEIKTEKEIRKEKLIITH
jgi:hypothetical protein